MTGKPEKAPKLEWDADDYATAADGTTYAIFSEHPRGEPRCYIARYRLPGARVSEWRGADEYERFDRRSARSAAERHWQARATGLPAREVPTGRPPGPAPEVSRLVTLTLQEPLTVELPENHRAGRWIVRRGAEEIGVVIPPGVYQPDFRVYAYDQAGVERLVGAFPAEQETLRYLRENRAIEVIHGATPPSL